MSESEIVVGLGVAAPPTLGPREPERGTNLRRPSASHVFLIITFMLAARALARLPACKTRQYGSISRLQLDGIPLRICVTNPCCRVRLDPTVRQASSSSSTRWKARQAKDSFAKDAKVKGLMSRAAFKLLEINDKHRLFRRGDTIVDLGYAPGSWSQVAVSKTQPNGRVLGIDIIPAQPPRGVSTIQGNFLDPDVQAEVRAYVRDPDRGRPTRSHFQAQDEGEEVIRDALTEEELDSAGKSYIDLERQSNTEEHAFAFAEEEPNPTPKKLSFRQRDIEQGRLVDVVLSDMSAPWSLLTGQWVNSISNPYHRMMNTSGVAFRDHAGSMDLCLAALAFCFDTLRTGGHFVCKFYQGAEDKDLERRLRVLFEKVHREKPGASRDVSSVRMACTVLEMANGMDQASKEAYFIGLRRKPDVTRGQVIDNE